MHRLRSLAKTLTLALVCLTLVACEARITETNYEKIQTGMSRAEVDRLLGSGGVDETASGTSITGAGIADSRGSKDQVIRWKDGAKHIVVTFRDGKVFQKTQVGLE